MFQLSIEKLEVDLAAHGANILNGLGRTPKSYDMINLPSRGIGGIVKKINDKYHVRTFGLVISGFRARGLNVLVFLLLCDGLRER